MMMIQRAANCFRHVLKPRSLNGNNCPRSAATRSFASSNGLAGDRLPVLRTLLENRREGDAPLRILETHSGLSGLVAEHAVASNGQKFDGMWSSSLTASAVRGMPDIEVVDTSSRLALVQETLNVTTKPMLYDGDTGGLPEIFRFTVRTLEQMGVSAVIIEDKEGLKRNSLLENSSSLHQLCHIDDFCDKIEAGLQARRSNDFMIFARMESLIAGRPMEEALSRAMACVEAGASGVMIHSRKKSPAEVLQFMTQFRTIHPDIPIVVVPTSYNKIHDQDLGQAGASICIYANQMLRAAIPAMMGVADSILSHSRSHEAEKDLMPVKAITNLINDEGVTWDRKMPVEEDKKPQDGMQERLNPDMLKPPKSLHRALQHNINHHMLQNGFKGKASFSSATRDIDNEKENETKPMPSSGGAKA
ncbi:Phosphoenolpyruvate phosphomutase [Seminavis robusta]|uniref:phosphoenolpyruvate mutase n=1 Tax=Seminavis robusta TaxID=568900 RepID=A0A9N8DPL4_9STRA|nr:Phosphoenolpyruvate phosphomutase [Seminavis robusta]|eukprot:Sro279_g106910.1 Phosphoenolpyruvate phosphomutase (418) ;mRNA; r:71216-72558